MNKLRGIATQEERTVASTSTSNIAPLQSRKYAVAFTPTEEGSTIPEKQQTKHAKDCNWIRYKRDAAYKLLCDIATQDEINTIPEEEQATNTKLGSL